MLRDFVARTGAAAEVEAVTAERDFFKEKYVEQIDEMEALKAKLKESQRVIDRLRSQVLELEAEKARLAGQGGGEGAPLSKNIESAGSSSTSTTCLTEEDDLTPKSGVENDGESASNDASSSGAAEGANTTSETDEGNCAQDVHTPKEEEGSAAGDHSDDDSDNEEEESGSEDDEADKIRANAERMLLWANYQTSKRSTPNTSVIQDDDSKTDMESRSDAPPRDESDRIVYSLPTSLDKRQSPMDDDSTLGSSSRQRSIRSGNASAGRAGTGKIGKLLGNFRDMIDPPSESESESEGDSDDESVISEAQHEH